MRLVNSLEEIGAIPLQVNGHLVRISIPNKKRDKRWDLDYRISEWIRAHCPNSSMISHGYKYDPESNADYLLVEFPDVDLDAFCAHWEQVDGTSREPELQCALLRRCDYVESIRQIVRARWGIEESPKIGTRTLNRWEFELSDEENSQRLHDLYRLRHIEGQVTTWEMLDVDAQAQLLRLNDQLREIERWAFDETMAIRGRVPDSKEAGKFRRQKVDSYPFPSDFFRLDEVKIKIDFALGESDPQYDEDDDNYFYCFKRSIFGLTFDRWDQWETGLPKTDWQRERFKITAEPMRRCFLFNYLLQRSGLDLADLLCVGNVFVDLIYTGSHVSEPLTAADDIRPRISPTKRLWTDEFRFLHNRPNPIEGGTYEERITPWLAIEDLSDADQAHCQRINAELSRIEHETQNVGREVTKFFNGRVADENDNLDDFEIELYVSHILHLRDESAVKPCYNVLLRQYGNTPSKDETEPRDDLEYDWSEPSSRCDLSFPHCWLFHDLYDHRHLSWADLPRIDRIHASFEVWLQRWVSVDS